MHKIWYHLKVIWLAISYPFRKTYTTNVCHHPTKKTGVVTSFDDTYILTMPLAENGNLNYCLDCISKMAIRCAWCGSPIHIGDPLTLYVPKETFKVPEYAVRWSEDQKHLVGCLGWGCAMSGADRQGFWMPPGKVKRVPSPIEMILSGKNDGKAIIISDLSDPNDLGKIV